VHYSTAVILTTVAAVTDAPSSWRHFRLLSLVPPTAKLSRKVYTPD